MLSRAELDFLDGSKQVSKGYSRYLKHTIAKKLHRFEQTIPTLITNQETREWLDRLCNTVRQYPNTVSQNPNGYNTLSVNALCAEGSQRVTMEPREGFEPSTSCLQGKRSGPAELPRPERGRSKTAYLLYPTVLKMKASGLRCLAEVA